MAEYAPLGHVVGRVGIAPKTKETSKGDIVTFSVAVTDAYGTQQPDGTYAGGKTTWYNVAVWDDFLQEWTQANIYKGSNVAVEGPIKSRQLDNGTMSNDISAFKIALCEWAPRGRTSKPAAKPPINDEDPF